MASRTLLAEPPHDVVNEAVDENCMAGVWTAHETSRAWRQYSKALLLGTAGLALMFLGNSAVHITGAFWQHPIEQQDAISSKSLMSAYAEPMHSGGEARAEPQDLYTFRSSATCNSSTGCRLLLNASVLGAPLIRVLDNNGNEYLLMKTFQEHTTETGLISSTYRGRGSTTAIITHRATEPPSHIDASLTLPHNGSACFYRIMVNSDGDNVLIKTRNSTLLHIDAERSADDLYALKGKKFNRWTHCKTPIANGCAYIDVKSKAFGSHKIRVFDLEGKSFVLYRLAGDPSLLSLQGLHERSYVSLEAEGVSAQLFFKNGSSPRISGVLGLTSNRTYDIIHHRGRLVLREGYSRLSSKTQTREAPYVLHLSLLLLMLLGLKVY